MKSRDGGELKRTKLTWITINWAEHWGEKIWVWVELNVIVWIVRYYYDKSIMTKVHGKRYAYKFDFHGLMAACHSQAQGSGCDATNSMIPKYHPHLLMTSNDFNNYASTSASNVSVPSTNSNSIGFKPLQSTALPSTSAITQPVTSSVITSPDRSNIFWPYTPPFDSRPHSGFWIL